MKKIIAMVLVIALTAAVSVGLTMAYLTHTDEAVNVMTMGNVKIEQNEWQRAEGVGHIMSKDDPAKEGDLVPFDQNQPIYPAVELTDDANQAEKDLDKLFYWGEYAPGGNGLWNEKELANVRDKIVMVTNTGKTDAYFRTIVAFECPEDFNPDLITYNVNLGWYTSRAVGYTTIHNVRYYLREYTYKGDAGNGAGVLAPDETARPSLLQVYIDGAATNEDMAKLGDTWEILVVSQAVQAQMGTMTPAEALNEAFGEITAAEHPWKDGAVIPTYVATADELTAALTKSGTVALTDDITLAEGKSLEIPEGVEVTLDMDGHKLTNAVEATAALVNRGTLAVNGGTIVNENIAAQGAAAIHNYGTLTLSDVTAGSDLNRGAAVQNKGGTVTVNGGSFKTMDRAHSSNGFAYVFINNGGTMNVNDAESIGRPNGLFYASEGTIVVDGGKYHINEGANTWYVGYAGGESTITFKNCDLGYKVGSGQIWAGEIGATYGNVIIEDSCTTNWE